MSNKKKGGLVILALVLISVAREMGYVNLHVTRSKFQDQMHSNLTTTFYEYEDGKRQLKHTRKTSEHNTNSNDTSWNLGVHSHPQRSPQKSIVTDFEMRLMNDLQGDEEVLVSIQNVSLSGLYWVPLFKVGSCEYNFDIEAAGKHSKIYRGTVQGKIDFSIYGFSSVTEAKEMLSKKIAKFVIENVKKGVT